MDRAWRIKEVDVDGGNIAWNNPNPIFRFMDKGTVAHGPREATSIARTRNEFTRIVNNPRRQGMWETMAPAKRLFILLTKEVAKAYLQKTLFIEPEQSGILIPTKRKRGRAAVSAENVAARGGGGFRRLVWGKDFVLAKWVSGIAAKDITGQFQRSFFPKARQSFKDWVEETKRKVSDLIRSTA